MCEEGLDTGKRTRSPTSVGPDRPGMTESIRKRGELESGGI